MQIDQQLKDKYPGKRLIFSHGRIIVKDKYGKKRKKIGKKRYESLSQDNIPLIEETYRKDNLIYIPYDVISLKSSRDWGYVYTKDKGRIPTLKYSEQYNTYVLLTANYWQKNRDFFLSLIKDLKPPFNIGFWFIRSTRSRFDYVNMIQGPQDMMVRYKWIEDDNADIIIPHSLGYEIDKERQGLVIKVL
jgi:hypothetical protein